jgi:alkylation response protein AidB-like acyl-CoA dehydrogenase
MKGGLMTDEARAPVPGPEGSGIDAALSPIAITAIRDFAESADLRGPVLRNLLTGDYHICLLYSEPGAGSDLAAVQTRADRDGEECFRYARSIGGLFSWWAGRVIGWR